VKINNSNKTEKNPLAKSQGAQLHSGVDRHLFLKLVDSNSST
jgi:hypothetical protein